MERVIIATIAILFFVTPVWAEWNYYSIPDEMRGTATLHALTKSTNRVEMRFPYHGGSHAYLVLQKMPRRDKYTPTEVIILSVKPGHIQFDTRGVHVAVKFDDGPVEQLFGVRSGDYGRSDTLLVYRELSGGYDTFLNRLNRAKTLKVEIPFYGDGHKVFTFDVSGLDPKWPEIAKKDTTTKR